MTARATLPYADRRLHMPAEPVLAITETVRMIWDDMIDTMEAMPGVGLAAPQIGIMQRLAVVDASEKRGQAVRMANPEVLVESINVLEARRAADERAREERRENARREADAEAARKAEEAAARARRQAAAETAEAEAEAAEGETHGMGPNGHPGTMIRRRRQSSRRAGTGSD